MAEASIPTPHGVMPVAICAGLVDPGRVSISERWESQAALGIFRSRGPDTEQRLAMHAVYVQQYESAHAGRVRRGYGMKTAPDGLCCDR